MRLVIQWYLQIFTHHRAPSREQQLASVLPRVLGLLPILQGRDLTTAIEDLVAVRGYKYRPYDAFNVLVSLYSVHAHNHRAGRSHCMFTPE